MKTKIGKILIPLLFIVNVWAQEIKAPLFFALPDKDKVYIILGQTPRTFMGFNLYRKEGTGDYQKLNDVPIGGTLDPSYMRDLLGEEYEWVANALRADNETECLFKLRQPENGIPLSLISRKVATVLGRIYIDDKVKEGAKYTYKVALIDLSEKEFTSAEQTITVSPHQPPSQPPKNLKAEAKDSEVFLSWEYPPYKGGNDIVVGFNIYSKGEKDNKFYKITPVPLLRWEGTLSYRDLDVDNGYTYDYYITSVDMIGAESAPSNTVSAKPVDKTPPAIPSGLETASDEGKINIKWSLNLELDIAGYNIFRATSINGDYTKLNKELIDPDSPFYTDEDVESGKLYFYRVSAVDRAGNESKRSNAISGTARDTTPPQPPKNLKAEVKEHKVLLKWEAPPDKDLKGYYVYRGTTEKDILSITPKPLPKETLEYLDEGFRKEGLVPGESYILGVSAMDNSYNESKPALIKVEIPDDEPPSLPVSFSAHTTEDGKVRVSWQTSLSRDVKGYRIYRAEEGKEPVMIGEVGKDVFVFIDDKAERGKKYLYQMSAFDLRGNESEKTKPIEVIPSDVERPPTPQNIKVVLTDRGVLISWEAVKVDDLLGYNVYRGDYPSGVFKKLNQQPIKDLSFLDGEGKATHYYKVTAIDTSQNESIPPQPIKPKKEGK
jgi:fibronectin type 3 domain-containing protein